MRRMVPLLVVLCALLLTVNPTDATTNQGLEWGFDVGDRFDFHFRYVDHQNPVYSKEYDFYFEVAAHSVIPDGITGLPIPYLNLSCPVDYYFANGTDLGPYSAILPGLMLPIGNWTMWTSIIEAIEHPTADYATFDAGGSSSVWSYSAEYGGEYIPHDQGSASYLRADGVMTRFDWKSWDAMGSPLFEYHITRVGYEGGFPIILVAVAVLGIAAIVLIVFVKRR